MIHPIEFITNNVFKTMLPGSIELHDLKSILMRSIKFEGKYHVIYEPLMEDVFEVTDMISLLLIEEMEKFVLEMR